MKIRSSCEIEDFVETSLQAVCDTPIARSTGCVSSLRIYPKFKGEIDLPADDESVEC